MQETSTARTSPTSRIFCTTKKEENPIEHSNEKYYRSPVIKKTGNTPEADLNQNDSLKLEDGLERTKK